ncbi:HdeD family acid-resistance protein [Mesorhizobium sp.]|uniref:HdeD family acid-resistance protein n=1 Tax=Mesorhizobium sp. TaxID=1871066 RepID=UPI0025CDAAA1|nr:HdeD family acid-resistance protein [Mesorhizobium sp.]
MSSTSAHSGSPSLGSVLRDLADNWWLLVLRGVAAIAFGLLTFIVPGLTLLTLVFLWGIYAFADGLLALWVAIAGKGGEMASRWWLAVIGVAGILAGLSAFIWPGMTALVLLMFIAGWAIAIGLLQIWGAIRLRKEVDGEWLLGLSGVLSLAFGIFMFVRPGAGALAFVGLIGWFAIFFGCIYIGLGFRLRKHKRPS